MKKILIAFFLALPTLAFASGGNVHLDHFEPDLDDNASLQRGAKMFVNYCLGCHEMQYQRYERTAEDIGIPKDIMMDNLIFDDTKIGSHMTNALPVAHAKKWFGNPVPDLTLETRLRGGPSWVYTYLRSFYQDDSRPLGWNNVTFKDVGMPNVLSELQGMTTLCKMVPGVASNGGVQRDPVTGEDILVEDCSQVSVDPKQAGKLSEAEFDSAVGDLVNFMYYASDPGRKARWDIGIYTLFFLAFFFVFAYLLNREYWKDVH